MIRLTELRVLVLEDNFLQADYVRRELEEAGASVVGPYAGVGEAMKLLASEQVDCALLDVSLDDGASFEVARELIARSAPVVFLTGYGDEGLPQNLRDITRLQKPVKGADLVAAVARACGR